MSDYDRKWIKWLIFGLILGYVIGKCITVLLSIVVTNQDIFAFVDLVPSGLSILGVLIVLYKYNKEREDQLGK